MTDAERLASPLLHPDLLAYVQGLAPEVQQVFHLADRYAMERDDTLDESWQMAADVVKAFVARAEQREKRAVVAQNEFRLIANPNIALPKMTEEITGYTSVTKVNYP